MALGACLLQAGVAQAALAPEYQNDRDMKAMIQYVHENVHRMSGIMEIHFQPYYVKWLEDGKECVTTFERGHANHPIEWVGPAELLVPGETECD